MMPELPEVEALRRALAPHLTGRTIEKARLARPDVVAWPQDPHDFTTALEARQIVDVKRRGKYLGLHLEDDTVLWMHFRMTGKLSLVAPEHALPNHTHVTFSLDDGRELRYTDMRRFGRLWAFLPDEEDNVSGMSELGIEPYDLTPSTLRQLFAGRKRPVKTALLDQHLIAGLGNIYTDEILFRAGINPEQPAGEIAEPALERLAAVTSPTLEEAIQRGVNCSRELFGEPLPSRQPEGWMVYGRKNKPCRNCGTPLAGTRIAGRSSVYCPNCQRLRA